MRFDLRNQSKSPLDIEPRYTPFVAEPQSAFRHARHWCQKLVETNLLIRKNLSTSLWRVPDILMQSSGPTETSRLHSWPEKKADFVEPMECESVSKLREGSEWVYEIKLDGYRAIAVKSGNKVSLFSRRRKSFNQQYPHIVEALSDLSNDTVIDGEIVALDDAGRPEFNLLQNYRRDAGRIRYFVFDLLCHQDRDTTSLPLVERRDLLRTLKFQSPRIQLVEYLESSAANIVAAVKEQRPEGVIAKRRDSLYQPGRRTGA